MIPALEDDERLGDDIDMDRVIADRDYRRQIISRLRRERLLAQAQAIEGDQFEAAGEED